MSRPIYPHRKLSCLQNAALCSEVAAAAYAGPNHLDISHWPNRREFRSGSEHGVVVWNSTDVVVGIAGTDDVHDMFVNCDCRVGWINGFEVHRGYLHSCVKIASALARLDMPSFSSRQFTWWYTGHSAGGAKASILPLVLTHPKVHRIVTFASPRCFRTKSAAVYDEPITRIDHPYDLVPDLPLRGGLGVLKRVAGWSHVGRELYVWEDGELDTENGYWAKRVLRHVWRAKSVRPSRVFRAAVSDHSMARIYKRAMQPHKSSRDHGRPAA